MALRALAAYERRGGDRLLYIGEIEGGRSAGPEFFRELNERWHLVDQDPAHVVWQGLHDVVQCWQRLRSDWRLPERPTSRAQDAGWQPGRVASRIDYLDDPDAPAATSIVPAANVVAANDDGAILIIRRTDNGNHALPGGAMNLGEHVATTAVRETKEEAGIDVEVTGLVGVYTHLGHRIQYMSNGEVRQVGSARRRPWSGDAPLDASADPALLRTPPRSIPGLRTRTQH